MQIQNALFILTFLKKLTKHQSD